MNASPRISGYRTLAGTESTRTRTLAIGMLMNRSMKLPMNIDAIMPQATSGCFVKRSGPGWRPSISRAPSMTAVVPDPGMPRVIIGMRAPTLEALLAASGAARPSIAPLPNSSGCLEKLFSLLYAISAAIVPPAPGKAPMKNPSGVARRMAGQERFQSSLVKRILPNFVCIL